MLLVTIDKVRSSFGCKAVVKEWDGMQEQDKKVVYETQLRGTAQDAYEDATHWCDAHGYLYNDCDGQIALNVQNETL